MRPVEVIARALAIAHAQGKYGNSPDHEDSHAVRRFAEKNWPEHEMQAKRLIRSLFDQPPHITEAGADRMTPQVALNEILEAMARS